MIKLLDNFIGSIPAVTRILKDALFPIHCAHCDREGEWWCEECRAFSANYFSPICLGCGRSNLDGRFCFECRSDYFFEGGTAIFNYKHDTPLARLIIDFKYHAVFEITALWEKIIAKEAARFNWLFDAPLTIIPVPLHPRRQRERGFNQSEIIARLLAENFKNISGCAFDSQSLRRRRFTKQQTKLDRAARQNNLTDAFVWTGVGAASARVLLVDDVVTTGATAQECARILKGHGASFVWLATLAHG